MANANQNDVSTDESGLRFFGIGTVSKDKPRGSDMILVSPIEKISKVKGRINEVQDVFEVEGVDVNDVVSKEKITGEAHITAKWLPMSEGNRMTAPDVREGESVRLWRYGNENEYYWQTLFREPSIRRLETVLYAYGNLPSGNTPWDKESSYWHEASTHDGHLWWKTTQSNGEAFSYDIKLDTKNSTYSVFDNVGNQFLIDSVNTIIRLKNEDGSYVELDKKVYYGYAETHMTHESKDIHMKTPLFVVTAGDEGGYHSGPFVKVDSNNGEVQIGSGDSGYLHVKDGHAAFKTSGSISEETGDKSVKNENRTIEAKNLNEEYGSVTREIGSLTERTGSYSRSGGSISETLEASNRTIGTSTETFNTQDKTAGTVNEKVGEQKSQIDNLEQTSKSQAISSDTMKEEYGSQEVKAKQKVEELDTLDTEVKGAENRKVGQYSLSATGKVQLNSSDGIEMSDSTVSNLTVPGKITFGGEDLGAKLQELTTRVGEMGSSIQNLDQKSSTLETELSKTNNSASESNENVQQTQEDLNQTKQQLMDTGNRVSALEDEISRLKSDNETKSSELESATETVKNLTAQNDAMSAKIAELTESTTFLRQLVDDALSKAEEALNATKKA